MTKKTTQKQIKQLFSMHFISELREKPGYGKFFVMIFTGNIGFSLQQVDAPAGNTGSVIVPSTLQIPPMGITSK